MQLFQGLMQPFSRVALASFCCSGHYGEDQYQSKIQCYNCQDFSHYGEECKNPRIERNHVVNLVQSQTDNELALLFLAIHEIKTMEEVFLNEEKVIPKLTPPGSNENQSKVWYLDNGASNHMIGDKTKFHDLNSLIQGYVRFGDGSKVQIEVKDSRVFHCKNGEQQALESVYYIP